MTFRWGDDSSYNLVMKRGQVKTILHDFECATDVSPTITFDKAIKPGYQAQSYTASLNSASSPTQYKFVNVIWSLSGPGMDLRHIV
jgi:hypothetical protein